MFNNLIKRDENSKIVFSNKLIVVLVAAAAFFLFLSGKTPDKKNPSDISVTESKSTEEKVINTEETEKRLEEILQMIDGAGDVSVMIYYSSTGEKIVASDTRTRSEKNEKGEGVYDLSEDKEHNTVLYGGGSSEQPFVTEERLPKPGGIIVIAEGAKNEKVRYEIQEAVKALLGLSPNRIKVVARAQKQIK